MPPEDDKPAKPPKYIELYRADNGKRIALPRARCGMFDDIEGDKRNAKTRVQYSTPWGASSIDVRESYDEVRALLLE